MPLPDAKPGLVFRYEYVWRRQSLAGQAVGEKDRPACVVLAIGNLDQSRRVLIVPITTRTPGVDIPAMEIPPRVRAHLGFDQPSWIILNEANIDAWPTPDMRPIPGKPGCFSYGLLPLKMINDLRAAILSLPSEKRLACTHRDAPETTDDGSPAPGAFS